jgi:TonB family protein
MMLLLDLAIRSSVVLAIGLLFSASLRKRSAALRHRVLVATLAAAVLVMPASLVMPAWGVPLPSFASAPGATKAVDTSGKVSSTVSFETPASGTLSPVLIVWIGGALIAALGLTTGLVRVGRVAARASRLEDAAWARILGDVAGRYGLTRGVAIARTDTHDLLATWGLLRPQILVPRHAPAWTPERVHVVLGHELAHIRRCDWIVQMCAEVLRAILWFNPLMWIACARLRAESEQACDDDVLGLGVGGSSYAAHVLELARQCRRPRSAWASALPMAHPSTLERRIAAMLNPQLDRKAPTRRTMAALAAALVLVALPIAALRARQGGPAQLTGTIFDASGAVLPGVKVTVVTNQGVVTSTSNAGGRFEFPVIAPGKYALEVAQAGFRPLRQEVVLRDARDWDRIVTLQVGELSETVSVRESRTGTTPAQPAFGAGTQPLRVGGTIRPPRKLTDARPIYPPAMREAGLTGVVPIEAVIGKDGSVLAVRVLSAQVHPDFAIAAVDAVRQWRFSPTLLNGAPVDVTMTVTVRFDLED